MPKAPSGIAGALEPMASHVLLQAAVLGIGCTSLFGPPSAPAWAAPASPSSSNILTLDCHLSGGGYAIRDVAGRTLENGDGTPFFPQPRPVLRITAAPPRVQVTEGVLPHPNCASGPVLDSFAPVRFTWCQARYEITPREIGEYSFMSKSTSPLPDGRYRGNLMEAFIVGACALVKTSASR